MIKTIKKVTIVVPVLITNCQVSEKLKTGPVIPQITTMAMAVINEYALPVAFVTIVEKRLKKWEKFLSFFVSVFSGFSVIFFFTIKYFENIMSFILTKI